MAVKKFVELFTRLLPKGRAWDLQTNNKNLLDGISVEFGRSHDKATQFYKDFNLLRSANLAFEHSQDYLITEKLYNNLERQKIIVDYIEGDLYSFKEAIEDFAIFINVDIEWTLLEEPFIFGSSKFGDKFGYINANIMQLFIKFVGSPTCEEYNKIRWLVEYLKPPYLEVTYTDKPLIAFEKFIFGTSEFGDQFANIIPCEIIN